MKQNPYFTVGLIAVITIFMNVAENLRGQTPPEDVSTKVKTMWQAKQLNDLGSYLSGVENVYPNFVPAIAAAAFYDLIFRGKLNAAKAKLARLKVASDSSQGVYSEDFKTSLNASIRVVNDEIRIQTAHGKGEIDWGHNVNPQAVRNVWSEHLLPILDLLSASPKVTITSN